MGGTGKKSDGVLIYVDPAGDDNFVLVGCVKTADPPAQTLEEIDDTCLADSKRTMQAGTEEASFLEFLRNYEVGGVTETTLQTLYDDSKANLPAAVVPWRLAYPMFGASGKQKTWSGQVMSLVEETLENGALIQQTVRVNRRGAILTEDIPVGP